MPNLDPSAPLPDWARIVVSNTERDPMSVEYCVYLSGEEGWDEGDKSQIVWTREIVFGQTAATRAGGAAFVEAAREQERVAEQWARRIRERGGWDDCGNEIEVSP